jgi:hypothetical protein
LVINKKSSHGNAAAAIGLTKESHVIVTALQQQLWMLTAIIDAVGCVYGREYKICTKTALSQVITYMSREARYAARVRVDILIITDDEHDVQLATY